MLGFNHTLAGCIVAVLVPAPLVPVVAFASHFVLDATPHFGRSERFKPYRREFIYLLVLDGILCVLSLGLAVVLFPDKWFILVVGAFFSTLPDFLYIVKWRSKFMKSFMRFAVWIQWGERPYGWIFDVIYGISFTNILFFLANHI